MNKALKKLIKKSKLRGKPKIVAVNKPSSPLMKWLMIVVLFLLIGFSVFYMMKILSPSFAKQYAEKFTEEAKPMFEVLLVKRPDCPACIAFQPTFESVKASMPGVKFTEKIVNSVAEEHGKSVMEQYNISVVPTTIILDKTGAPIAGARKEGGMSEEEFKAFVSSFTMSA